MAGILKELRGSSFLLQARAATYMAGGSNQRE